MKKRIFKIERWTKREIGMCMMVFVLNVMLMIAIFAGAIFLNGVGANHADKNFLEYFRTSRDQFAFLSITLVLILSVTLSFLLFENGNFLKKPANTEMIFLIIEITVICSYVAGRYINIYFRPLALGALLTLLLVNRRTAVFMNMSISLITFMMDVFTNADFSSVSGYAQYSSLIIGFTSGIIGIYLIDGVNARIRVFGRGLVMTLPVLVCLMLLEQTNLLDHPERLVAGASSSLLSVVLFMAILPVFEWMCNKVTSYKLAELTEHGSPLIKRLIEEAPGTFNHCIVVSNLAESCAIAIGDNAMLARCAGYYHDMGKLKQPEFYKENQQDEKNPHNELTPELSANIIKAHTKDGYDLLKKYRLPQELADICLQHHGTMPMLFFYAKAKTFADGGEVDIERFSYSGPKPQTKIAAIIMIADAGEAAVRSIKERSRENVDKMLEKIINERMFLGQFDDCDITMKELNVIRNTIVNNLTGVYHKRVEYPKVNLEELKTDEE